MSAELNKVLEQAQVATLTLSSAIVPAMFFEAIFPAFSETRNVFLQIFEGIVECAAFYLLAYEILQFLMPPGFVKFPATFIPLFSPLFMPNAMGKLTSGVRQLRGITAPLNWDVLVTPSKKPPVVPDETPKIPPTFEWPSTFTPGALKAYKTKVDKQIADLEAEVLNLKDANIGLQDEIATLAAELQSFQLKMSNQKGAIQFWITGALNRLEEIQTKATANAPKRLCEARGNKWNAKTGTCEEPIKPDEEEVVDPIPTERSLTGWQPPSYYNTKADGSKYHSTAYKDSYPDGKVILDPKTGKPIDYDVLDLFWDQVDTCEKFNELASTGFIEDPWAPSNSIVLSTKIGDHAGYAYVRGMTHDSTQKGLPLIHIATELNKKMCTRDPVQPDTPPPDEEKDGDETVEINYGVRTVDKNGVVHQSDTDGVCSNSKFDNRVEIQVANEKECENYPRSVPGIKHWSYDYYPNGKCDLRMCK